MIVYLSLLLFIRKISITKNNSTEPWFCIVTFNAFEDINNSLPTQEKTIINLKKKKSPNYPRFSTIIPPPTYLPYPSRTTKEKNETCPRQNSASYFCYHICFRIKTWPHAKKNFFKAASRRSIKRTFC